MFYILWLCACTALNTEQCTHTLMYSYSSKQSRHKMKDCFECLGTSWTSWTYDEVQTRSIFNGDVILFNLPVLWYICHWVVQIFPHGEGNVIINEGLFITDNIICWGILTPRLRKSDNFCVLHILVVGLQMGLMPHTNIKCWLGYFSSSHFSTLNHRSMKGKKAPGKH